MRIRWSEDGTLAYAFTPDTNTKAALSATAISILDGDKSLATTANIEPSPSYPRDQNKWIMLMFPGVVSLSKFAIRTSCAKSWYTFPGAIQYSANTSDGIDGTWTSITLSNNTVTGNGTYYEFSFAPVNCTAVRIFSPVYINTDGNWPQSLFVFGDYTAPRFEFYESDGATKLSGDYPLAIDNMGNKVDWNVTKTFRIKNLDVAAHTYTVDLRVVRYGGDGQITSTKIQGLPVTTASVAAGAMSAAINLSIVFPEAGNPGDGKHYYGIKVTEN